MPTTLCELGGFPDISGLRVNVISSKINVASIPLSVGGGICHPLTQLRIDDWKGTS